MADGNKSTLKTLTQFNGIYLSGFYIRNPATITALSLLFEKVHLPNQLELVIEFSKNYILDPDNILEMPQVHIKTMRGNTQDPFLGLNEAQKLTVHKYLFLSHSFCIHYHELFPTVFTTDMLKNNKVFNVKMIKKGETGQKNLYRVTTAPQLVTLDAMFLIKSKLDEGFVPILGQEGFANLNKSIIASNKAIAAVLAMKSVEMMLPSFISANPQDILEARDKLKDHLPPFWSAMLRLSNDTKNIIKESRSEEEAINECQNIVDTLVRPALIELVTKMEKERRNWFYRIVSPVANTVKLLIGNPRLDQASLIRTSIALASDLTSEYLLSKQKIEDLKSESGLTYLLEVNKTLNKNSR